MPFHPYENALRKKTVDWAKRLGNIDVLVGIPSFNTEATIQNVVEQAALGLHRFFPDLKKVILVSDGGSTDETREMAEAAKVPNGVKKKVFIYRGLPGKGTSLRAIFESAQILRARAIIVVDADLRSITPEWIMMLAQPILREEAQFIAPLYHRHKYDGTITNMIVYPMTRALYGKRIRQPIGGDFGFSGRLAEIYSGKDVWMTDVARFGIDIWMTTVAINECDTIGQVHLGTKIHDAKDPAADLDTMFQQVISTLFFMMGEYEKRWLEAGESEKIIEFPGTKDCCADIPNLTINQRKLEAEFIDGFEQFGTFYKEILDPLHYDGLLKAYQKKKRGNGLRIDAGLWCGILYDFAYTFQNWSRNRRRLANIMSPLYFGRTASYTEEVKALNWEESEQIIDRQAEVFEKKKEYLKNKISRWEDI